MIYFPIVKAKKNDLKALENLSQQDKEVISPVLEIPTIDDSWLDRKHVQNHSDKVRYFCDRLVDTISAGLRQNAFSFDISSWPSNTKTMSGVHIYRYLSDQLLVRGCNLALTVNYSAWDDRDYQVAVVGAEEQVSIIRLDSIAIEDSADYQFFQDQIDDIVSQLNITVSSCRVLMDFGNLDACDMPEVLAKTRVMVTQLSQMGFVNIGVGGGSMPDSITKVAAEYQEGRIKRQELVLFNELLKNNKVSAPLFIDYGIRPASIGSDFPSPHANGKIRYTINGAVMVFRGVAKSKLKHVIQHSMLAQKVKSSQYFIPGFSWGDNQIVAYLAGKIKAGDLGSWVAIDTNHHLTFVSREIVEAIRFRTVTVEAKSTTL